MNGPLRKGKFDTPLIEGALQTLSKLALSARLLIWFHLDGDLGRDRRVAEVNQALHLWLILRNDVFMLVDPAWSDWYALRRSKKAASEGEAALRAWHRGLRGWHALRALIESVFASLDDQFQIEETRARSV